MNLRLFVLICLLTLPAVADNEVTLEKIMSHPRWIGAWPEEVVFNPNGNSIFYLSHADPRGYEVVEVTDQGEVIKIHDTESLPKSGERRGEKTIYSFKGDLFLSTPQAGRLTRTRRPETECRWLDDDRFVFRADDDYYVHDLNSKTERQVVDLRFQKEPKPEADFRSQQQDRLFPALKEREDQLTKRSKEQNIPRFYLGKDRELVRLEITPDEQHALLIHGAKRDKKRDKMPVYLNRDGAVETKVLRAKVGAEADVDHQLSWLDLRTEKSYDVDLSGLPGYSEGTTVYWEDSKWSKDGRLAISLFSEDYEERWLIEVNLSTGKLKLIEHLHDDAWHSWDLNEFGWIPKSQQFWFQSEKTGYAHLYLWNGKTSRALTSGKYEVSQIRPSPDGKFLYYRSNQGNPGRYNVYRVTPSGRSELVSTINGQTHYDLSPDGKTLALLQSTTTRPPVIFVQEAKPGGRAFEISAMPSSEFLNIKWTTPEFVNVPSTHFDGSIRSKLYLPPKGVKKKLAAVVFVHGAGYLQNADEGWSYYFREFMFHTLLARRGVTVLDMDYRASAGYGRDWRTAIYRQMGTPELEDLKDGVAYLVKEHGIDPKRVGVYGGSYGGFMTLMALFKEPDLFACGAALRPVTDWAQYEHDYTARILNTPDEDPESFLRSSPIEFAEGLTKPLLMCHGMLDDNVVAQDTVRLTQRLIQLKKKNWETALYPIEPHGFIEPESWLDEYRRILKLFEENLGI